ncbi:MAG: hypothetical protein LBG15_02330 [Dysgonamonadaceae bacterium]|nr:hypothetical protein [Dysgonamonadaceae bacterium]
MKRQRLAKLFIGILGISMLLAGPSWASVVDVPIGHNTISYLVDGKTDYAPTVSGTTPPKYGYTYVELYPTDGGPEEATGGTIALDTKTTTVVEDWYGVSKGSFTGGKNYSLVWSGDYDGYYLAADDGSEIRFAAGAETGFSEMEITVSLNSIQETVKIPVINTTAQQMADKCVPYIELVTDGNNISGARWRFVDPAHPSVALTRKQAKGGDIGYISYVSLYNSPYEMLATSSIRKEFTVGETLSGVVAFDKAVPLDRIGYVRIAFQYDNSWISNRKQLNPYMLYSWIFYPNDSDPVDSPPVDKGGNGGGGCNLGMFGMLALLGGGIALSKRS